MYMSERIGKEFPAVVSGVSSYGLFAELPNTIEGFIPIESIPGSFECIPERFLLKGSRESYSIGDTLRIKVVDVDFYRRRAVFTILEKVSK